MPFTDPEKKRQARARETIARRESRRLRHTEAGQRWPSWRPCQHRWCVVDPEDWSHPESDVRTGP